MMAFQHIGKGRHFVLEGFQIPGGVDFYQHKDQKIIAELAGIDPQCVLFDHAALFQLADSFRDGGNGEGNPLCDFRGAFPAVFF